MIVDNEKAQFGKGNFEKKLKLFRSMRNFNYGK